MKTFWIANLFYMVENTYPASALPTTTKTVFTFLKPKTTTPLKQAIKTVRQSVTVSHAKSIHTVMMIANEAVFTPSRKAENNFDRRIRGNSGFDKATNTKEGRNTANVAITAPSSPFICQPINVTDEKTGPGVNCPTAMASTNCVRDNNPLATNSLSRKANSTYPLPYRIAPIFRKTRKIRTFASDKKGISSNNKGRTVRRDRRTIYNSKISSPAPNITTSSFNPAIEATRANTPITHSSTAFNAFFASGNTAARMMAMIPGFIP